MIKRLKLFIKDVLWKPIHIIQYKTSYNNEYLISWDYKCNNFGDILNPYLINKITDKKIKRIDKSTCYPYEHYLVIGSILNRANKNSIIWGSGFISEDSTIASMPKKICSVRGPKTRKKLLDMGIFCPEIYGDPALLISRYYSPNIKKKYKLGIIPHYIDKDSDFLQNFRNKEGIKIIDIQNSNTTEFIDELMSCDKIASSSLHGIITADSYSIPAIWVEFSNNVVGNGFKFEDYFLSVGRLNEKPLIINKHTTIEIIFNEFKEYSISINLDKLLDACPFIKKNEKNA